MKYLGIDYGSKRVGVAISDPEGRIAFPREVLHNDKNLFNNIDKHIKNEGIDAVVIGYSKNYKGEDNPIQTSIANFREHVETRLHKPVYYESEWLTSHEAQHVQKDKEFLDARAAALLLQSYLDKHSNKTG